MGRTILLGAGVAVLLLLAWLALDGRDVADGPGPPRSEKDAAEASALPAADATANAPTDGAEADATTSDISGTVRLDRDGSPVAGATVRAMSPPSRLEHRVETRADAEGRFALRVEPGSWLLVAAAPGVATGGFAEAVAVTVSRGRTVVVDLVVTRAGVAVGRVLADGGAPVPGARVRLWLPGTGAGRVVAGEAAGTATTDAAGRFRLGPIPCPLEFRVRAETPEGLVGASGPIRVFGGHTATVEVRLPASRSVDVLVLEAKTDRPVPDAEVRAGWSAAVHAHLGPDRVWRTDEEGRVRVGPLPDSALTLWVDAASCAVPGAIAQVEPDEHRVTIRLPRAGVVAGEILFPDGTPLSGGRLRVYAVNEAGGATNWSDLDADVGFDGRFRVERIPEGRVRLLGEAIRDGRLYETEVETKTGEEDLRLLLAPAENAEYTALVLDPEGRPVRSGRFTRGTFEEGRIPSRLVTQRGRVETEVWDARNAAGEPLPVGAALFHFPEPEGEPILLRLPPERVVEGRVLGPDGDGVAGVRLLFRPLGIEGRGEEADPHADVRTGPDGSFRAGRLGDFEYLVEVRPPVRFAPVEPLRVRAGERDVRIRLEPGIRAVVTVLDADGKPVAGAEVRAQTPYPEVEDRGRAWTDADGVAVLDGLPSGVPLHLEARAPRDRPELPARVERDWVPADATLQFGRSFSLDLTVVDGEGEPVPGAQVRWRVPPSREWRRGRTDPEGRLLLRELAGERVVVRATSANGIPAAPGVAEHELAARGEPERIEVDPGHRLRLHVADWPRGDGGVLWILSPDGSAGRRWLHAVDGEGDVDIEGVPLPARIMLRTVREGRCALLEEVPPGDGVREVRLGPGATISGRLLLPDDATWGIVTLPLPGGTWGKAEAGADGRFELTGVPPGRFTIRAITPAGTREVEATTGVPVEIDFR